MLNFAIYVLEFISVLLIIHLVFQSRFRMDFAAVVLFLVSMLTLFLAYFTKIQFITYATQLAFCIYAWYEFRRGWWETFLRFACSIAIIAILETLFRGQFVALFPTPEYPLMVYLGVNACMFICAIIFYWFFIYKRMYFKIDVTDKTFIFFVVVINLFVLYVKDDGKSQILRLVICLISFLLLFGRFVIITNKEKRKNSKMDSEWLSQYAEQYEELIEEVRRRQHDYKNEIQTIMTVCAVGNDTIAMDMIREHVDEEQYTGILNGCENPMVAGLVYSKIKEFAKQGVTMKCHIRMRNTGLALEMWEVIDIIGILLDNAFECTREQEKEVMNLEIVETDKGILIKTINPSPYVPYTEISKMFSLGYSTKGKNRGIGLHTVRKLVKKCNGEIVTGNQTYDDDNYFELQVMIPICF